MRLSMKRGVKRGLRSDQPTGLYPGEEALQPSALPGVQLKASLWNQAPQRILGEGFERACSCEQDVGKR